MALDSEVGEDVVKVRHFADDDIEGSEYVKLVVHRDLLDDDERAVRVLDEVRDELADATEDLQ